MDGRVAAKKKRPKAEGNVSKEQELISNFGFLIED
jgi:hypothetical protein